MSVSRTGDCRDSTRLWPPHELYGTPSTMNPRFFYQSISTRQRRWTLCGLLFLFILACYYFMPSLTLPSLTLNAVELDLDQPPHYKRLRQWETDLPQHNLDLPFPEGRTGRYVLFKNQIIGLGWNNELNEVYVNVFFFLSFFFFSLFLIHAQINELVVGVQVETILCFSRSPLAAQLLPLAQRKIFGEQTSDTPDCTPFRADRGRTVGSRRQRPTFNIRQVVRHRVSSIRKTDHF